MEIKEDAFSENSSEENDENPEKIRLVVISSQNDTIKIHTNAISLRNLNMEDIAIYMREEIKESNFQTIVDISKMARELNINQIKELSIKTLNPDLDYLIGEDSFINNSVKYDIKNEENKDDLDHNSFGLNHRTKNQKLTRDQVWFLKNTIDASNMTIKEIQFNYNVSYSTLSKIKRCSWSHINQLKSRNIQKIYGQQKDELISAIIQYITNTKYTSTAKEITSHVNKSLNTTYSVNFIRSQMKKSINLSFKRVKSRPYSINLNKIKSIRHLFAIKFSKIITKETLLINIDESSINRHIKWNYSWGFKGKSIEVQNSGIEGSVSMILGICSNGSWINAIVNKTIDSKYFEWYLKIVCNWLNINENFGYTQVINLLDNWAIHKSKLSQTWFKKMGYTINFIPAYSPDFAPVEMWFSLIKRNLAKISKESNSKISVKQNYAKIFDSLSPITSKIVKNMFAKFFKTINEYL